MRSQRYLSSQKIFDPKVAYSLEEAVRLAKKTSSVNFDATIEMHCRMGIDPKKGEEAIRGTIALPHAFGKTKKIAAFVEPEREEEARAAGADLVGGEELIGEIVSKGKTDFDVAVATPGMMSKMAKAAKILGPKGLMPNPKTDTVGLQIGRIIAEQKAGKINFKNDDTGNVHVGLGKCSMDELAIQENAKVFLEALKKTRRPSSKGIFIRGCVVMSTMGPGIKVTVSDL